MRTASLWALGRATATCALQCSPGASQRRHRTRWFRYVWPTKKRLKADWSKRQKVTEPLPPPSSSKIPVGAPVGYATPVDAAELTHERVDAEVALSPGGVPKYFVDDRATEYFVDELD